MAASAPSDVKDVVGFTFSNNFIAETNFYMECGISPQQLSACHDDSRDRSIFIQWFILVSVNRNDISV